MAATAQTQALPLVLTAGEAKTTAPVQDLEQAAVAACQRGEREAFDGLVVGYKKKIYGLCYRYVNNHEDANDLTQEVFLKAWKAIGRFRGQSSFSTWLYRIAVNASLNFLAKRRQTQELPDALPDLRMGLQQRLEEGDQERRLREAVGRLPEKQRATLILKIYQELTHQEVAQVLGSTVGTVKANLFHALGNLRRLVREERE